MFKFSRNLKDQLSSSEVVGPLKRMQSPVSSTYSGRTLVSCLKEATFDSYLTEILSIQSTFDEPGRAGVTRSESVDRLPEPRPNARQTSRRARGMTEPESD